MKKPKFYLDKVYAKPGEPSRGDYQGKKLAAGKQQIDMSCFPIRGGLHCKWPTRVAVEPQYWNFDTYRVREVMAVPNARRINTFLDKCEAEALRIVEDAALELVTLTHAEFREAMDVFAGRKKKAAQIELLEFIHRSSFKEVPQGKEDGWLEEYHVQAKQLRVILLDFILHMKYKQLHYVDIDMKFYSDFMRYMEYHAWGGKGYKVNTRGKHINTLSTLMRRANKRGLHQNLIIDTPDFKVVSEEVDALALYIEQIQAIYNADITESLSGEPLTTELAESYSEWRYAFVLDCFIGLRFGDFSAIDKDSFTQEGEEWILEAYTSKSEKTVYVPCHWIAVEIVNMFDELPVLPANATYNKALKVIAYNAGLTQWITQDGVRYRMYEKVTAHTARRSLAVNFEEAGIPRSVTMAITGHSKEKDFIRYIQAAIRSRKALNVARKYKDFFRKPG